MKTLLYIIIAMEALLQVQNVILSAKIATVYRELHEVEQYLKTGDCE